MFNVRETSRIHKLYKDKLKYKNYIINYEQNYFEKLLCINLRLKLENIISIYIEQVISITIIYRNSFFKLVSIAILLRKKIIFYRK